MNSPIPAVTTAMLEIRWHGRGGQGVIATLGLVALFDVNPILPFGIGSAVLIVAVVLLFLTVKEPDASTLPHPESEEEEAR